MIAPTTCWGCVLVAALAGVVVSPHDIFPIPLDQELVLELELWMALDEGVDIIPGSGHCEFALPMDEDLANAMG